MKRYLVPGFASFKISDVHLQRICIFSRKMHACYKKKKIINTSLSILYNIHFTIPGFLHALYQYIWALEI